VRFLSQGLYLELDLTGHWSGIMASCINMRMEELMVDDCFGGIDRHGQRI
jgi:hypothetical protein